MSEEALTIPESKDTSRSEISTYIFSIKNLLVNVATVIVLVELELVYFPGDCWSEYERIF